MAVCKRCNKAIYDKESNVYGEKCRSCYAEENYLNNRTASVIKWVAVLGTIGGIIYAIMLGKSVYTEDLVFPVIIVSVISAVFVYGFGEIIQKLQNIEDNTIKK